MRRVRIDIDYEINRTMTEKEDVWNIPIIKKILSKRKTKIREIDINVSDNS